MPDSSKQQENAQITIFANDIVINDLKSMVERAEMADLCTFEHHEEMKANIIFGEQSKEFRLPVRIGTLFDQISVFSRKAQRQSSALLNLNYGILDTNLGKFTPSEEQSDVILLTEKEVEVLQYLYDNADRKIPRDELLKFVWGYAKNTETHTLETHIYRLRQKIEHDPASPKILKKDENGYYLGSKAE